VKILNIFLITTVAAFSTLSFASQMEIVIRPATLQDLEAITALSSCEYQGRFKILWEQSYAPLFKLEQNIDDFIAQKIVAQRKANEECIQKQTEPKGLALLVAYVKEKDKEEKLAGYCRFKKENDSAMYINYVLVDEDLRKQGIGKKLMQNALKTFDGVTECKFRALIHDTHINNLYEKYCTKTGLVSLDPNTGKVVTESNAPITHADYSFVINK